MLARRRRSKMTRNMVDYSSQYSPYKLDEQHGDGYYSRYFEKFEGRNKKLQGG